MEKEFTCKTHNKRLKLYCKTCNELLCSKCLSSHAQKGCIYPIDAILHAKTNILPKYKAQLKEFEERKTLINNSLRDFVMSGRKIKEGLIQLRKRLKELLGTINKAINLLEGNKLFLTIADIKTQIINEYELLQISIQKEDLEYISKKLDGKVSVFQIGDTEEVLIKDLNKLLIKMNEPNGIASLNESLMIFNEWYTVLTRKPSISVENKFVYGICEPKGKRSKLCKYDIMTRKLIESITVPECSSTIQINKQVFISGGYVDALISMNGLSEFIESSQSLVTKQPMKYRKRCHSLEAISNGRFVTIGGYSDGKAISYCEEYSISEDKWRELPALNKARHSCGTVLINMEALYAIGGYYSDNRIEVINLKQMKQWTIINVRFDEIEFDCYPTSFPITDTEIMILCGNETTDAGVLDTRSCIIKKCSSAIKADDYFDNSVTIINNKAYILGYYGHMHIYDIASRQFDEISYSDLIKP